jgi:hypothetical protein
MAEARLEQSAAALGLADPRPPYRERLRSLRETHPDAFQRALTHYENVVLPAMTSGDALTAWLSYASFLAGLTADGELHTIDETGRASVYAGSLAARSLVLFVPVETSEAVLVAAAPLQPSAAQQATVELLVNRRLSL